MKAFFKIATVFVAISLLVSGCQVIKDIFNTMENVKRLQFKLADVSEFNIAGISIGKKATLSEFVMKDIALFTSNVLSKKFPVSFVLTINAKNPNDGKGGRPATKSTISAFPWDLYVNDTKTISGNISKPIYVPGTGQAIDIPIKISMDFFEFFSKYTYKELAQLALSIGGVNGTTSQIKLKAKPAITTPYGTINYPGQLTIMSKEWTN